VHRVAGILAQNTEKRFRRVPTSMRRQLFDPASSDLGGVAPLFAVQFLSGVWILTQMSFFPIYLEEVLRLTPLALAAIVASGQAAGMVAALWGGGLSDSLGSKRVLVIGLAGSVLASLVFQSEWLLPVVLLWMLGGAMGSLHTLGGASYLTRAAHPQRLGLLSALFALCMTVGGALGSPLAGWLLDTSGFRLYGWVGTGLVLITLAAALLLLPALGSERDVTQQPGRDMLGMARRPAVRMLIGLRFLPTLYYGMSGILIPLMIHELAGNKTTVALYGAASLIIASAAQLLAGRAADRFGHRWPPLIGYGALIVAALGVALFADHLWGVIAFGILGAAAAWSLASLLFTLVADGVPRAEHGRAFGLLHATWSVAMIGGALLGGALTRLSPGLPFLVAGLLNIGSIVLVLAFFASIGRGDGSGSTLEPVALSPISPD